MSFIIGLTTSLSQTLKLVTTLTYTHRERVSPSHRAHSPTPSPQVLEVSNCDTYINFNFTDTRKDFGVVDDPNAPTNILHKFRPSILF